MLPLGYVGRSQKIGRSLQSSKILGLRKLLCLIGSSAATQIREFLSNLTGMISSSCKEKSINPLLLSEQSCACSLLILEHQTVSLSAANNTEHPLCHQCERIVLSQSLGKAATAEMKGKATVSFAGAMISPISLLEAFCPIHEGSVSEIFQPKAPEFQVVETEGSPPSAKQQ